MEGSNQEEPTKISKENTYTYWVDKDKQNNANITKKEPQKIDPSKIQS